MSNRSRLSNNPKSFSLKSEDFTDEQNEILKLVKFPTKLNFGYCLQRRVIKKSINNAYVSKKNPDILEISYVVVGKEAAENQINRFEKKGVRDNNDRPIFIDLSEKEYQEVNRTKAFDAIYCDAANIQSELDWLFDQFASPNPTPSGKVPNPTPTPKAPTKKQITLIEKLALEGNDAAEIAESTGIDKESIIALLKSQKDGKE